MNAADLRLQLEAGLRRLGSFPGAPAVDLLLRYLEELRAWNRAYNLTAVRSAREMVVRHLLDSVAVAPWLHGRRILDAGSGAGLPGIPLAVLEPHRRFTLLDSNGKKVRFLRHVRRTLSLGNVDVVQCRVEEFLGGPFDTVVSRAFAEPARLLAAVRHLVDDRGRVLAMLGRPIRMSGFPGYGALRCEALQVPGLEAERHLLIVEPCPESSP